MQKLKFWYLAFGEIIILPKVNHNYFDILFLIFYLTR